MNDQQKRAWELVLRYRDFYGTYNHQKENAAYVAIALFLTGATAAITGSFWTSWTPREQALLILELAIAALLTTIFVLWQFRQRTFAVSMVDACTDLAARWIGDPPSDGALEPTAWEKRHWPKALVDRVKAGRRFPLGLPMALSVASILLWTIAASWRINTYCRCLPLEDLMSASWWIVAGGVLALAAGVCSVVGAVKNSQEQEDLILGGRDTFCQLITYVDMSTVGWYLGTYHHGRGGNIYDVDVLIREVQENGTPISPRRRTQVGPMTSNTWSWMVYELGIKGPQTDLAPRYFEAQITQRSGTSLQDVVVYPQADGRVRFAFVRLEFSGRPYAPDFRWLPAGAAEGFVLDPAEIRRIEALRATRGRQP